MATKAEWFIFIKNYVKEYFGIDLYPYQQEIIYYVLSEHRKVSIRATTRAGKSYALAIGAIMYASLYPGKTVGIIAPTKDKSRIIMTYIFQMLALSKQMEKVVLVDMKELSRLQKLGREVSKQRISFRGNGYIEIKSADVNKRGFGTMGFAYDLTIVDETAEIPEEVYTKIYRMLVQNQNAKLFEIGNPWYLNHFYAHKYDDRGGWVSLKIDWERCVREGRMTLADIEDQKRNMSELEFRVLFEAEFPEDIEYSIFTQANHIDMATRTKEFDTFDEIHIGVDVARGGADYTVYTVLGVRGMDIGFIEYKMRNTRDTMLISSDTMEITDRYKELYKGKPIIIKVDVTGVGAGVYDRLTELGYEAQEFVAGKSPHNSRFFNFKSEAVFALADIMYQKRFYNLPKGSKYIQELKSWTFEVRSDRKVKVVDPDKSPDYSDSLVQASSSPASAVTVQEEGLSWGTRA